ncbi:hypothetical protein LS73_000825 [Helicobacter muridarum]|uniref:Periplasmic protein n=1 Tax=Helicobacter muridarum TaxID=216 RepID=A0A377PUM0_9HELI|nr:hypothetical protein [Helicobacter muridarum]TLE01705.1 hypothetical protein LS73_000825 [Helicobacter muridarum]STQ86345.1 Putative periplasmic protein [Helicobacter muridarum]
MFCRSLLRVIFFFSAFVWADQYYISGNNFYTRESYNHLISPIPIPTQEVVRLDSKKCTKNCLNSMFDNKMYFSFMSKYIDYKDDLLSKRFNSAVKALLDSEMLPIITSDEIIRIALLIPQKSIGRYSASSAVSILSYLITKGVDFEFDVFDSQNEDASNLSRAYSEIQEQEFNYIIAILTGKGLENLINSTDITTPIFVPTLNKYQIPSSLDVSNIFFGGIDYKKQIQMVLDFANDKKAKIISYNDDGVIGRMLGGIVSAKASSILAEESVDSKQATKFGTSISKVRKDLKQSVVILNTSVTKSGLIIPQIGNTSQVPIAFLSTQINYNPYLLRLVPKEDSKNIFVVSSIGLLGDKLLAFSDLLSSDLQYDWVNYATALGVDVMLSKNTKGWNRFFSEKIQNNQVLYHNRFYGVKDSHFVPIDPK